MALPRIHICNVTYRELHGTFVLTRLSLLSRSACVSSINGVITSSIILIIRYVFVPTELLEAFSQENWCRQRPVHVVVRASDELEKVRTQEIQDYTKQN
jgi:precorrin-4 methylase